MNKVQLQQSYQLEFETVEIILQSEAVTKSLDAFILSWIKYEKQLRKLLCFLVYQHPIITKITLPQFDEVIVKNNKLFPDCTILAIEALSARSVASWVGSEHPQLSKSIDAISKHRNKLLHGHITGEGLEQADLLGQIGTIKNWICSLANGANAELQYDGLARNTFKQAKKLDRVNLEKFPFDSPEGLRVWVKKFTHPQK